MRLTVGQSCKIPAFCTFVLIQISQQRKYREAVGYLSLSLILCCLFIPRSYRKHIMNYVSKRELLEIFLPVSAMGEQLYSS